MDGIWFTAHLMVQRSLDEPDEQEIARGEGTYCLVVEHARLRKERSRRLANDATAQF